MEPTSPARSPLWKLSGASKKRKINPKAQCGPTDVNTFFILERGGRRREEGTVLTDYVESGLPIKAASDGSVESLWVERPGLFL